jgi:hypothetical protein
MLEPVQQVDVPDVELDGQAAFLTSALAQMPVGLQEAEHVGVLGYFEVHEASALLGVRLAFSHREVCLP